MMMVLGRYYFGLETAAFQSMARKTNYQWSASQGLPHSQLAQFIGQDVDTMRLQGVIYPHYKGGLTQIDAMRAEAKKGKPLLLIQGNGQVLGEWLILSIEETQQHFNDDGLPHRVHFNLQLRAFKQDKLSLAKQLKKTFGL